MSRDRGAPEDCGHPGPRGHIPPGRNDGAQGPGVRQSRGSGVESHHHPGRWPLGQAARPRSAGTHSPRSVRCPGVDPDRPRGGRCPAAARPTNGGKIPRTQVGPTQLLPSAPEPRNANLADWRKCLRYWSRHTDSNRGPADYKSAALPTELRRRVIGTRAGSGSRSRQVWAAVYRDRLARRRGINCALPGQGFLPGAWGFTDKQRSFTD